MRIVVEGSSLESDSISLSIRDGERKERFQSATRREERGRRDEDERTREAWSSTRCRPAARRVAERIRIRKTVELLEAKRRSDFFVLEESKALCPSSMQSPAVVAVLLLA